MQAKAYIAIAALVAVFLFGVTVEHWRSGNIIRDLKLDIAEASASADRSAREEEKARQKASNAVADAVLAEMELERATGRVVVKKVIEYVESPDSGQCDMPDGWVQTHDIAAGAVPGNTGASSGVGEAPGRITDIEALIVVTDNYQVCREAITQVKGWQKWYRETFNAD